MGGGCGGGVGGLLGLLGLLEIVPSIIFQILIFSNICLLGDVPRRGRGRACGPWIGTGGDPSSQRCVLGGGVVFLSLGCGGWCWLCLGVY